MGVSQGSTMSSSYHVDGDEFTSIAAGKPDPYRAGTAGNIAAPIVPTRSSKNAIVEI
jgi:hypothetical protein